MNVKNDIKISMVLACFNRANLLDTCLYSLNKNHPNYTLEIIVVNDALDSDNTKTVCEKYKSNFDIKYYFSGAGNKDGNLIPRCPAIPNNIAIKKATGDILILTCPEIYHLNKCIDALVNPLLHNKKALTIPSTMYFDEKGDFTNNINDRKIKNIKRNDNHAKMPFLMGVWKSEVLEIGGYDEDFIGYASEDNDFIQRLLDNGCKHVTTEAQIVHLYHGKRCPEGYLTENPAWCYNRKLFETRRGIIKRNINKNWGNMDNTDRKVISPIGLPKILHMYWDGSPISRLQTMTVTTFHRLNPNWEIRIYIPIQPFVPANNKYVPDYTGKDHWPLIESLPYVKIIKVDITEHNIDPTIHNILQSDIFRYKMLYEHGGLWSDFDVIWLKSIAEIQNIPTLGKCTVNEMGAMVCRFNFIDRHHNISVLLAKPKHPMYKFLIDQCMEIQAKNKNRESLTHQVFGTDLWDKLWDSFGKTSDQFHDVIAFPYKTFYPYSIYDLESLYKTMKLGVINSDVLCVHWFNGHKLSKEYINNESPEQNCSMTKILSLIKRKLI